MGFFAPHFVDVGVIVYRRADRKRLWQELKLMETTEALLVEQAVNGDVESFCELSRRYYPALVAIAHAILGDRHLAEDAAQESLAKACRKLDQLKNNHQFAHWLAMICRNVARDMIRKKGKDKLYPVEDLSSVEARSGGVDLTDAVREAVAKLPEPAKELVFLRFYDGLSYEKISSVLGISKQAINGRLRRAKESIAVNLKRDSDVEVRL